MARRKPIPPVAPATHPREAAPQTTPGLKSEDGNSSLPSPRNPKATPRKRKMRRESLPKSADPPSDDAITGAITGAIAGVFGFIFELIGDIFRITFRIIRKPISIFLSLYILAVTLAWVYHFAQVPIHRAFCKIPGVSLLEVTFCDYDSGNGRTTRGIKSDFPKLINLQSSFDSILENSLSGSHMATELKRTEIAVRDLNMMVRVSDLLMCREEISARIDDFIETAKSTSRGLSRFGSRVNRVVDSLLAMDEYALRALERVRVSQIELSSRNVIASWALRPFKPWNGYAETEKDVLSTFIQASSVMDNNIQQLIREAQMVVKDLDELENRLEVIQEMFSREGVVIEKEHNEILAQLWTTLGGNRKKLSNFSSHHTLLQRITVYRSKALHHIAASLIRLQQMQADLEDLRDRVVEPALLADSEKEVQDIPLEVHIESIRRGLERLNLGRSKAKEIETNYKSVIGMHDEAIQVLELDAGPEA